MTGYPILTFAGLNIGWWFETAYFSLNFVYSILKICS